MLEGTFYRYGWDTRCRNLAPARLLRAVLHNMPDNESPLLLDVGCGKFGVAAFLPEVQVVGVDREMPADGARGFTFKRGDVAELPFPAQSFPVVSCIDVLEHLSPAARERAIGELMRVASHAVLIACPHGRIAIECDEEFRRACARRARSIPGWLLEHQSQSYPELSALVKAIDKAATESGLAARISISYCEPARVCRFIRAVAARSDWLYLGVNLLFGLLFSLLPTPGAGDSYRVILLVNLVRKFKAD